MRSVFAPSGKKYSDNGSYCPDQPWVKGKNGFDNRIHSKKEGEVNWVLSLGRAKKEMLSTSNARPNSYILLIGNKYQV